jgi:hypothetical protein
LTWPRLEGVEFVLGARRLQILAASEIGNVGDETNGFTYDVSIITQRAGSLTIPPIVAKSDGRSGRSRAVKLEISALPLEGRPASFLGGVGTLSATAEVNPRSVRIGEPIEFRIVLDGPSARGTSRAPDLAGFAALPLGLTIGAGVVEGAGNPTTKIVRYRLRPTRAGEAELPGVAVASFDPKLGRYVTRKTAKIAVKVVDVPEFDPEQFGDYGETVSTRGLRSAWIAGLGLIGIVFGMGLFALARAMGERRRQHAVRDPRLVARRTLERLHEVDDREVLAATIVAGIAECLRRAIQRPEGALTPDDARNGVLAWTENEPLAVSTRKLVSRCDEARFAGRGPSSSELAAEARPVLEQLAAAPRRTGG